MCLIFSQAASRSANIIRPILDWLFAVNFVKSGVLMVTDACDGLKSALAPELPPPPYSPSLCSSKVPSLMLSSPETSPCPTTPLIVLQWHLLRRLLPVLVVQALLPNPPPCPSSSSPSPWSHLMPMLLSSASVDNGAAPVQRISANINPFNVRRGNSGWCGPWRGGGNVAEHAPRSNSKRVACGLREALNHKRKRKDL